MWGTVGDHVQVHISVSVFWARCINWTMGLLSFSVDCKIFLTGCIFWWNLCTIFTHMQVRERMHHGRMFCTLYLLVRQRRFTVGDSSLCCVHVISFQHWLSPLCWFWWILFKFSNGQSGHRFCVCYFFFLLLKWSVGLVIYWGCID